MSDGSTKKLFFLIKALKLDKCFTAKEALLCDSASTATDISDIDQTIENRCFKRISCVNSSVPLTKELLKASIYSEMRTCGNEQFLDDVLHNRFRREHLSILDNYKELNVLLLWSTFCKRLYLVEELVHHGADLRYFEYTHGMAAVHIAAFLGSTSTTLFLISRDPSNINTINKYYSPLHCATIGRHVETAKILLENGARLNSLTNGPRYETPLYIAVKFDVLDCVQLFVERNAEIYQEGKLGDMSPLFLAAQLGRARCLKILLKNRTLKLNILKRSESGNTALHIAAQYGHPDCIQILLEHGADPNATNLRQQSALHLAVKSNSYPSVVMLITSGNVQLNLTDHNQKTALHEAVELVMDTRREIVKLLIENGADVNAQDQHGFTPLHITALNELPYCAGILISNNADCSIKSISGLTAFCLLAKKTPQVFEAIKDKFTEHISLVYHSDILNEVEMKFDFTNGLHHPKEYSILNAFIDAGHKEMLLHPFIMAFLCVTWGRIRRCYYGMIYNSIIFSVVLLWYVLLALAYDCHMQFEQPMNSTLIYCKNNSKLNRALVESKISLDTLGHILLYFTLVLMYRKIYGFHGYPSLKHYCINWGNILEWSGIFNVFIISFLYTGKVETWQIHVGAVGVICAWTNVMYLISQLPTFGPYVEMFQKVLSEFLKLLFVFFPFLVGFTMGFCVIFPNSSAFYDPLIGFISVLVMMTGDMNYNILLDYSKEENSSSTFARATAHSIYTIFLLFVTIILMNLLVGIAVHDIQGLQKTADLSRLVRQAKMCSYIELSHYKRSRVAKSVMTVLRVVPKKYIPLLRVKPLDPQDKQIPKEVVQAAYDLVKQKENTKKKIFSRTRSDGSLWRNVKKHHITKKFSDLMTNQLLHKIDHQNEQIKDIFQELSDLKNMVADVLPTSRKNVTFYLEDELV